MRTTLAMLGVVLGSVACTGSSDKDSGDATYEHHSGTDLPNGYYPSTLSPGASVTLARCADGVSEDDIDETLAIVFDMEQSYHEMIGCGGMVVILVEALFDVISSLVDSPSGGVPDGFTQDGAGTYTASPGGGTLMQMHFVYGEDYAVGSAGEPVQHNLFKLSNYLVNPRVDFDYETGKLLIRYDETGPLVELLGFGANPDRPIRINLDNLGRITREIEKLQVQSNVEVSDSQLHSDVSFHITSPAVSVGRLLSGQALPFTLVTTAAEHHTLEQAADVSLWDVDYADHSMDGTVEYTVNGGAFDYHGTFEYRGGTWPDTTLTCVE